MAQNTLADTAAPRANLSELGSSLAGLVWRTVGISMGAALLALGWAAAFGT
jgi:hypothetical protein